MRLAAALNAAGIQPDCIYCGPLQRMRVFADVLSASLDIEKRPVVEGRLTEVDYGSWNSLTNQQVIDRVGTEEFNGWYYYNVWPASSNWMPPEDQFRKSLKGL